MRGPRVAFLKTRGGVIPLLDVEALEREVERASGRDAPRGEPIRAVALVRLKKGAASFARAQRVYRDAGEADGDDELADLADLHPEAALVPALDDAADARVVGERLLARVLGGPELLARLLDHARRVDRRVRPLGDRRRAGALGLDRVRRTVAAGRYGKGECATAREKKRAQSDDVPGVAMAFKMRLCETSGATREAAVRLKKSL